MNLKSCGEAIDSVKSVCAMLNKYGEGVIYYGVKNDGGLVKNEISDSFLRDISRAIYECIEPKITPYINTLIIDGVEIIKLSFYGTNNHILQKAFTTLDLPTKIDLCHKKNYSIYFKINIMKMNGKSN